MELAGHWIGELATWVKLTFEAASILIIVAGGVAALWALVAGLSFNNWLKTMRPRLSRYLLAALELQLAADIVGTALSPTWEQLGKLATIAIIRTFLNYFLVEELQETGDRIP